MKDLPKPVLAGSGFLLILAMFFPLAACISNTQLPPSPSPTEIVEIAGDMPLSFIPNVGQAPESVEFLAQGIDGTLFFTPHAWVLSLPTRDTAQLSNETSASSVSLHIQFEEANPAVQIKGDRELPATVNYFIGNRPGR